MKSQCPFKPSFYVFIIVLIYTFLMDGAVSPKLTIYRRLSMNFDVIAQDSDIISMLNQI